MINPTSQASFIAFCLSNCSSPRNINWNIYQGKNKSSSSASTKNFTQWTQFNPTNLPFFFGQSWSLSLLFDSSSLGGNSDHFTVDQQFFLSNPEIDLWRFEVVYSCPTTTSSSALNFLINHPPSNGSCSISPENGTTLTPFSVSCPSWFDEDGIKDYSLFTDSNDSSRAAMIAFSSVPDFDVYLPRSDDLRLMIWIRDRRDSLKQWTNLSGLTVRVESNAFDDFLHSSNGQFSKSNPFLQLLAIPNQNRVGQILSSLAEQLNRADQQNLHRAISSSTSSFSMLFFILPSRRRNSGCEYFHFFVGLSTGDLELLFALECFCAGRIWKRFQPSSESSRIFNSISPRSSCDEQLEHNSNSIQISRWTNSIDESTLSISSRTSTNKKILSWSILIVDVGFESLSSFGFVVVVDGRTNSSWRSSNVFESTRSMCHKSSHGHSPPESFLPPSLSLFRQWMDLFNNERVF